MLQAIRSEHEIVPKIERWRELSTLIKTYMDVLPEVVDEQSRVHTTFLQAVAQTGRLSSTNPNMQNVPIRTELGREIRGCFEAEPGWQLISADYSQVELRVLANAAEEPVLDGGLQARRRRAHGDRLAGVRGRRRRRSTRACARRRR